MNALFGLSIKEFHDDAWQYTESDAPFSEAELDYLVDAQLAGMTPCEAAAWIDVERAKVTA